MHFLTGNSSANYVDKAGEPRYTMSYRYNTWSC